jgi:hypothetical protein
VFCAKEKKTKVFLNLYTTFCRTSANVNARNKKAYPKPAGRINVRILLRKEGKCWPLDCISAPHHLFFSFLFSD